MTRLWLCLGCSLLAVAGLQALAESPETEYTVLKQPLGSQFLRGSLPGRLQIVVPQHAWIGGTVLYVCNLGTGDLDQPGALWHLDYTAFDYMGVLSGSLVLAVSHSEAWKRDVERGEARDAALKHLKEVWSRRSEKNQDLADAFSLLCQIAFAGTQYSKTLYVPLDTRTPMQKVRLDGVPGTTSVSTGPTDSLTIFFEVPGAQPR